MGSLRSTSCGSIFKTAIIYQLYVMFVTLITKRINQTYYIHFNITNFVFLHQHIANNYVKHC